MRALPAPLARVTRRPVLLLGLLVAVTAAMASWGADSIRGDMEDLFPEDTPVERAREARGSSVIVQNSLS